MENVVSDSGYTDIIIYCDQEEPMGQVTVFDDGLIGVDLDNAGNNVIHKDSIAEIIRVWKGYGNT